MPLIWLYGIALNVLERHLNDIKVLRNTKKKCEYALSAFTHNPEVVGSSPASATRSSSRNGFRYDYFFAVSFILAQSTAEEGIASVEVGFFLPLRNL